MEHIVEIMMLAHTNPSFQSQVRLKKHVTNVEIDTFVITQECNMGGEFFRTIFSCTGDDKTTYFESTMEYYFDKQFHNIQGGDVVKDTRTDKSYNHQNMSKCFI